MLLCRAFLIDLSVEKAGVLTELWPLVLDALRVEGCHDLASPKIKEGKRGPPIAWKLNFYSLESVSAH